MTEEQTIGDVVREKQRPTLQEQGARAWAWVQARAVWIIIALGLPYLLICWALTVLLASLVAGGPSCGG